MQFCDSLAHLFDSLVKAFANRVDAVRWVELLMQIVQLLLSLKLNAIKILDNVLVLNLE